MRNIIAALFLLLFAGKAFAATVGSPADMTVPEASIFTKTKAVNDTLDFYESKPDIKAGFDAEFIFKRKLDGSPSDNRNMRIEGQNFGLKMSANFMNVIEPYVRIGTTNLTTKWEQHGQNIRVDAEPGFVLGGGAKVKVWEFENSGIKLTLDGQYRDFKTDVDKATIDGSAATASASDEIFEIKDWQMSLIVSKKFILPLNMQEYYIIPYGGLTYSDSDVNVHFTQNTTGLLYSTYNASDENNIGVVFGCDVMPSLLGWYLLSFELRFINETAFTLAGTVKF